MNRIEELRALEQSATPGPWYSAQRNDTDPGFVWAAPGSVVVADVLTDDHAFLAAMRNALPDLLAVVDAAQEVLRAVDEADQASLAPTYGPQIRAQQARSDALNALADRLARLQGDKEDG